MMICYLGLGSNLCERFDNLLSAVKKLDGTAGIKVVRVSKVYETEPVGDPEQPKYLNAAVGVETDLEPKALLKKCLAIEREMGRVRKERWESRLIDIDVLLCGEYVLSTMELIVPHPLLHEREFVLKPLADIAPDSVHPILDETVSELLDHVDKTCIRKMEDLDLGGFR